MMKATLLLCLLATATFAETGFLGALEGAESFIHELKEMLSEDNKIIVEQEPYFTEPVDADELVYVVGGWDGWLSRYYGNGTHHIIGNTKEFQNTSWIAPTGEGVLISNEAQGIISFVDFRGADKLHTLQNLTAPVMIGESFEKGNRHWYAGCHGWN